MSLRTTQETGRPISYADEGIDVATNVGRINATGAGQTVTALGSEVTVDVPGGGSAPTMAYDEVIAGTGLVFTLAHAPNPVGSLVLVRNRQTLIISDDYTVLGTQLTLTHDPIEAGEALIAKQYSY